MNDSDNGPITERPENPAEYDAICCAITARDTYTDMPVEGDKNDD